MVCVSSTAFVWRGADGRCRPRVNGRRRSSIDKEMVVACTLNCRLNYVLPSSKLSSAATFPTQLRYQRRALETARYSVFHSAAVFRLPEYPRSHLRIRCPDNRAWKASPPPWYADHHRETPSSDANTSAVRHLQLPVAPPRHTSPHMHEHLRSRDVPGDNGPEQGRVWPPCATPQTTRRRLRRTEN